MGFLGRVGGFLRKHGKVIVAALGGAVAGDQGVVEVVLAVVKAVAGGGQ